MSNVFPLDLHSPLGTLPTGRLQLFTILCPFFGAVDAFGTTKKSSATTEWRLRKLLKMWRDRVEELGAAGWQKALHPVDRNFLMNCLPTACRVSRRGGDKSERLKLRMCNRPNMCPWCWARRASTCFERFEKILFPYVSPLRLAVEKFALDGPQAVPSLAQSSRETLEEQCELFDIVFMDRHRHLLFDDQLDEFDEPAEDERRRKRTLTDWLLWWSDIRAKQFMKTYRPFGAVDFFVVVQDHGGGCSVHFRHLLIYPAGEIPDVVKNPPTAMTWELVPKPTRRQLIDQLAKVFRYPRFYMDGTPGRVADILNTLERLRIRPMTQFGAVSGKQRRNDPNS